MYVFQEAGSCALSRKSGVCRRRLRQGRPTKHSITASIKNCVSIADFFAPTAFRRPISLVRSDIETSIIFIMPTPPTNSEMPTMPPATSVTTIDILLNVCIAVLRDATIKVSGSSGPMCRSRRKKNFNSPTPSSTTSADLP